MKKVLLLVLAVSFLLQLAAANVLAPAATIDKSFSTKIDIKKGEILDINLNNLLKTQLVNLKVSADKDCTFSVDLKLDLDLDPRDGVVGLGIGYKFVVSNGATITVTITRPSISLVGNIGAGFVKKNSEGSIYLDVEWNADEKALITRDVKIVDGEFVGAIGFKFEIPLPTLFDQVRKIVANAKDKWQTFVYSESSVNANAEAKFKISINAESEFNLVVKRSSSSDKKQPSSSSATSLGVWFKLDKSAEAKFQAKLEYKYTSEQLAAAKISDETALRFGYYNEGKKKWEFFDSEVDKNSKSVTATASASDTARFSELGIYAYSAASVKSVAAYAMPFVVVLALFMGL